MNTLILYKSKYGAVKRYAEMLEDMLGCPAMDIDLFKREDEKKYDRVIFAGGIYAGGVPGLKLLHKKVPQDKIAAVFCVGAAPFSEEAIERIKLSGKLDGIPIFHGRGVWDESIMKPLDRAICRMIKKVIAKKQTGECEPWMRDLLHSDGQKCDWVDKKYLEPLVELFKAAPLDR